MPIRLILLVVALVAAVLLCLPFDAFADVLDAPAVLPPFVPPSINSLLSDGAVGSLLIVVAMLFLRASPLKRWLAPAESTDVTRMANMALVIALGFVVGRLHVGPQVCAGDAGWLLGGFLCGGMAAFGRDVITDGLRLIKPADPPTPL